MKSGALLQPLPSLALATRYPCCGGRCRIRALTDVPRQSYDRRCPQCGQLWGVMREVMRVAANGTRYDKLEWVRVPPRK